MRFVMKLKNSNNGNREGQSATLVGKVEERRLRRDQSPQLISFSIRKIGIPAHERAFPYNHS